MKFTIEDIYTKDTYDPNQQTTGNFTKPAEIVSPSRPEKRKGKFVEEAIDQYNNRQKTYGRG